MANLNIKVDGMNVIKKIGIQQAMFDWLAASPFTVMVNSQGMHFNHPTASAPLFTIAMTINQVTHLQAGSMSPMVKQQLRDQIVVVIQNLQNHPLAKIEGAVPGGALGLLLKGSSKNAGTVLTIDDDLISTFKDKVASGDDLTELAEQYGLTAKQIKDAVAAGAAAAATVETVTVSPGAQPEKQGSAQVVKHVSVASVAGWDNYDLNQLKTGEPIQLRVAQSMYQPVKASSPGSRYFLVAGRTGLKVAARYLDGTLSVRIEGDDYTNYVKQIKDAGIDQISKDYASVHLKCDPALASKALGALITGLGIAFETPIPQLAVIAGQGA